MAIVLAAFGILLRVLLVQVCLCSSVSQRDALFDDGWKFFRGDSPSVTPKCSSSSFPVKIGRCMGLHRISSAENQEACLQACCSEESCTTWQWMPTGGGGGSLTDTCWIGDFHKLSCSNDTEGWVTGARNSAPDPSQLPPPSFAKTDFDDSAWRDLDLPHDWAIEDLPERDEDVSVPAITIRNGTWLFSKGDNPAWASPNWNDHAWTPVTVPHDWRDPPTSYEVTNAIAWYRRNFTLSAETLELFTAAPNRPALALGVVACSDTTYVNGRKVGSMSSCVSYRSYLVDPSTLLVGENNVAVRVQSPGGKAGVALPDASPGGICDTGAKSVNGVSVATGADWTPPSPFDAARSLATGANGRSVGYSTAGHGWYRKTFLVDASPNERVYIRFDGSYMNTDLWCNGHHVYTHPYGYTTWEVELTPYLSGSENVIAVRLRTLGANSRWYSGSGLFRHVWLTTTPTVRIGAWGVSVATPSIAADKGMASTRIGIKIMNADLEKSSSVGYTNVTIRDPLGNVAGSGSIEVPSIAANSSKQLWIDSINVSPTSPDRMIYMWNLTAPRLYTALVTTFIADSSDSITVPFGIRSINFSADSGFLLNGEPVTLKGGCVHHDNGILGSAAIDRAEERRVELLKANGYNAIRTSHNPVSPAFLDACDRIGMLVMDEAFDCWEKGKNPDDYHIDFDEWWQRDLSSMILRDINHPSVILWSIGNEIPMRMTQAGYALARNLTSFVHMLDPTRPVTSAVPMVGDKDEPFLEALDVGGYNYSPNRYEIDHTTYPNRVMVGTESFPKSSFQMWSHYTNNSWVIGDFIWTAIDYIGESAIGNAATSPDIQFYDGQPWEWHISFCGDIDIVGMEKPQSFYRRVLWDTSPIEMLVHNPISVGQSEKFSGWGWPDERDSWNWPEASNLSVRVFSKCSTESVPKQNATGYVALTLNGKEVTGSPAPIGPATEFIAEFSVPFEHGTLEAHCTNLPDVSTTLQSASMPTAIMAKADRLAICDNRNSLSYITAEVVDDQHVRVPDAREVLNFKTEGVGEVVAVGTGNPTDVSSFHTGSKLSWQGRVVAIVRPGPAGKLVTGSIQVTITSPNLQSAVVNISVVPC